MLKNISAFREFCESENTVSIGFLVLLGFGNAYLNPREGFFRTPLIDGSVDIARLCKCGYWKRKNREQPEKTSLQFNPSLVVLQC